MLNKVRRRMDRAVFGALFCGGLVACSQGPESPIDAQALVRPAKIVTAIAAGEVALRVFPGTVEAAQKSDLAFRVGGQLQALPAQPGMAFKVGELLARLDDAEFRNALSDREARYKLAKSQYDKILKLRENNHTSSANVDEAEANLKAAEAALAVARDNLQYTHLLAPFSGVVANVQTENHQVVNANQTVLSLRSDGFLDVRFSVPESLLGKLRHIDDPNAICAQVRFNAYPQHRYTACFKEYESTPDRLTRTYSVVHSMPAVQEFPVLPGMAVSVELDLSGLLANAQALGVLVPLPAVFEQGGQSWVWRVGDDMRVQKQAVTVAKVQDDFLLIVSGLDVGDELVAVGVSYLRDNMQVKAMSKERGL